MLSYRHSFHAGNFADVLKHIVLVEILEHLRRKPKPFDYIDTHAGCGLYSLDSDNATALAEHETGISALEPHRAGLPELGRYFDVIDGYRADANNARAYPGSPAFACASLRRGDRAWLHELHPQDFDSLRKNFGGQRPIRLFKADGYAGLRGLLQPVSRRGLVLIDPSYEVKTEYVRAVKAIIDAHKKFATGIYALWYPVVERQRVLQMHKQFKSSGIRNIQSFELGLMPDNNDLGMTASGMIVINPPWTLMATMEQTLPKLVRVLGEPYAGAFSECEVLVAE